MEKLNPCLACGACCANFRVSFYWGEANDATEGGIPVHLTEKLNDFRRVMLGTNRPAPRCIALKGEIGGEVSCAVYPQRSSTCRGFEPSWVKGVSNESCDKARVAWGLLPLQPDSWLAPENFPKAA